ncbi:hypothetical protein C8Q80DRAFT_1276554 [Daedaleopsis nitida]|nr:hypothetical protein C8Q80DRAFT_1276554 [Daedaleopsis nitida]
MATFSPVLNNEDLLYEIFEYLYRFSSHQNVSSTIPADTRVETRTAGSQAFSRRASLQGYATLVREVRLDMVHTIARAAPFVHTLKLLLLPNNAPLADLDAFTDLRRLDLEECGGFSGNIDLLRVLAALEHLEELENVSLDFLPAADTPLTLDKIGQNRPEGRYRR